MAITPIPALPDSYYNSPPTAPNSLTHGVPKGGYALPVSWGASADANGDAITYTLEHSVDSGAWVQDGAGIQATGYTATVPSTGVAIRYRVKATDSQGAESAYTTGASVSIVYNADPVISGTDSDLGSLTAAPSHAYTVADDNAGDILTVVEALDGVVLRTITSAVRGQSYTLTVPALAWRKLSNGPHTLTISVDDGQGGSALRTLTLVKAEDRLEVYRGQSTLQRPNKAKVSVSPGKDTWPTDATVNIWVANNGNDPDADIVWVDVPTASIGDVDHAATYVALDNTTKGEDNWCVAVKVVAQQGASGQPVRIARLVLNVTGELEVSTDA